MTVEVVFPLLIIGLLIVAPITAFVFTQRGVKRASKLIKTLSWSLRIASLVPWLFVVSYIAWLAATSRDYDPDITKWVEVQRPTDPSEHDIWFYAADYSHVKWRLSRRGNKVSAHLYGWRELLGVFLRKPPFVPRAEEFTGGRAFHVDDGWLVAFNEGEFGAALYWFGNDGRQNYKISDDQVVDFMSTPQGIIAIQGLAHLSVSYGSVIRLAKDAKTGRWTSTELKRLPQAPESFVRLDDDRLFLALSDSLVSITADNRLETLVDSTDWVRPDTIEASHDALKIYVGAWQYVCEYDIQTKRFRYLVPDLNFVNKLPKKEEDAIRREHRD